MRALLLVAVLAACEPALDQRLDIVRQPRVLAIISAPAEVKPGASATYTAVVATPDGPSSAAPAWALCTAPKPPTEDNAVSTACLGDGLVDLGAGATATATIPADACAVFGPDVQPGFRPRDPDPTGGFYQPVRADTDGADLAFGFTRITCNLANAPADAARMYQLDYVANANPTLAVDAPTDVAAGDAVTITASWPAASAESFLYYDVETQQLVTRREAMHVAWFATAGEFPADASAVGEDDPALSVATTWHAPATPGPVWLWVVLRDSRGGLATQTVPLSVAN